MEMERVRGGAGSANGSAPDDLTRIAGLAKVLTRCRSASFGYIDGWRQGAQKLAEGTAMPPKRGGPAAGDGQHYESFVVRVLLNDDGSIRDTRMEHVGTGEVKRWAGWEHDAMLRFIEETAAPAAPAAPVGLLAAPVGPLDAEPHPEYMPESVAEPSATSQVSPVRQPPVTAQASTPSPPAQPEASQPAARSAAADASPPWPAAWIVRLWPDRTLLRAAQSFGVTLSLDLTKAAPQSDRLIYSAVIVARQVGGRSGRTLASPRGLLKVAGITTITIDAEGLPPGIYLLEAAVSLRAAGASHGSVAAMADGIMLQVLPS